MCKQDVALPLWVILLRTKTTKRMESEQTENKSWAFSAHLIAFCFGEIVEKLTWILNCGLQKPQQGLEFFRRFLWAAYVWVPLNNAVFSSTLSSEKRYCCKLNWILAATFKNFMSSAHTLYTLYVWICIWYIVHRILTIFPAHFRGENLLLGSLNRCPVRASILGHISLSARKRQAVN